MQVVSPETRAALQSLVSFFKWMCAQFKLLLSHFKANWHSFVWRFAPLWVPFLLIWALPMPREIARYNSKRSDYDVIPPDPLKRALAEPDNLGAHLIALSRARDFQEEIFAHSPDWNRQDNPPPQPRLKDWLQGVESHFQEPWIPAFVASVRQSQSPLGFYLFPRTGTRAEQKLWLKQHRTPEPQVQEIKKQLEVGARKEPRNAFWIISLAWWEWRYAPRTFYPSPRSNFATVPPRPIALAVGAPGVPTYAPPVSATSPGVAPPAPPIGTMPSFAPGSVPVAGSVPVGGYMSVPVGPHPLSPLVSNEEEVVHRTFAILERTRYCTYFEDGNWQGRREMARDWENCETFALENNLWMLQGASYELWSGAHNSLPGELQKSLWGVDASSQVVVPYAPIAPPQPLVQRLPPRQLLSWQATLAHISNLIDRHPRLAFSRRGRSSTRWLNGGWSLDLPRVKNKRGDYVFKPTGTALSFAVKARRLGRPDLAREAIAIESEFAARDALHSKANFRHYQIPSAPATPFEMFGADSLLPRFAFIGPVLCETIATTAMALCSLWMFLNFWLIRGEGAPSSSRSRWAPALLLIAMIGAPTLWAVSKSAPGTGRVARLFEGGPPAPILFAAPVAVMLALWCIFGTVVRHHEALISAEDDRWHTHFLSRGLRPWIELIFLGTSALMVIISAVFLCYFTLSSGSGLTPVPLGFLGITTVRDVMGALGIYGFGSGGLGFIAWLMNWRFGARMVWPLTNAGLRWWKECIGASICVLVWLYLLVALAAWPARSTAKRMIAERWQMGDWVWLQKNL